MKERSELEAQVKFLQDELETAKDRLLDAESDLLTARDVGVV